MAKRKKQKNTVRNNKKYSALDHYVNIRSRIDKLDMDYIDKLSEKEKKWLNTFIEEEVHASFHHKGRKLNKSPEDRKRVYNANNAWNRDIVTRAKVTKNLDPLPKDRTPTGTNHEDVLIDLLDSKLMLEKSNDIKKRSRKRNKD